LDSTHTQRNCRVAIAAYLHDLGKLAQRAEIGHGGRLDASKAIYCPLYAGRYTHVHAAYTALAWDALEEARDHFPDLRTGDQSPFQSLGQNEAGSFPDSIVNACASHHRPETRLQWIIATADRIASGFERNDFDDYNAADDRPNFKRARLLSLFEQLHRAPATAGDLKLRLPLSSFGPQALLPVPAQQAEPATDSDAVAQYRVLWQMLTDGLRRIPRGHRNDLALWLDHFDSLWLTVSHAIPSATAGNVMPDVSLYDHSRTTAALAVALFGWLESLGVSDDEQRTLLRDRGDGWDRPAFRLILGDLSGIQEFLLASGGGARKREAKLLRGRSFAVSLLAEAAALRVLEAFDLPPTSLVMAAAGKFLIAAPNLPDAESRLAATRSELDAWFVQNLQGRSGLALASLSASANDFTHGRFGALLGQLYARLDVAKLQRFGLAQEGAVSVLPGYLERFKDGVCAVDGLLPAEVAADFGEGGQPKLSRLSHAMIRIGEALARHQRIAITRTPLAGALGLDFFGYRLLFTGDEAESGRFTPEIERGNLVRLFDFGGAPDSGEIWTGHALRFVAGHVPRDPAGAIIEFDALALEGVDTTRQTGLEALAVLKGDVDDLGALFASGLKKPSFARWASLSRQLNAYFALRLPWLLRTSALRDADKPLDHVYTVYCGGDDFFLVAPWKQAFDLAGFLRDDFARFVGNPRIHFSLGIALVKSGIPVRQLAAAAEVALDEAKGYGSSQPAKDAVCAFGQVVRWSEWDALMGAAGVRTRLLGAEDALLKAAPSSAGAPTLPKQFLYALLRYSAMREAEAQTEQRVAHDYGAALWRSHFAYQCARFAERTVRGNSPEVRSRRDGLRVALAALAIDIDRFGARYRIPLSKLIYERRSVRRPAAPVASPASEDVENA